MDVDGDSGAPDVDRTTKQLTTNFSVGNSCLPAGSPHHRLLDKSSAGGWDEVGRSWVGWGGMGRDGTRRDGV